MRLDKGKDECYVCCDLSFFTYMILFYYQGNGCACYIIVLMIYMKLMILDNKNYNMKFYKYILLTLFALWAFFIQNQAHAAVWVPPSYKDNFSQYLTSWEPDREWRVETVYELWIDSSKSLKQNVRCLFYPNSYKVPWCDSSSAGWKVWDVARYIWFAILVIYLVIVWVNLLIQWADSEKVKTSLKSLIYILYWSVLFFGSTWILGGSLWVETVQWTEGMVDAIQWWPDSLFFKIISALKALAFFVAIIMIVVSWFKIMAVSDQSDKTKTAIRWIINVVIALVMIKIIDYVYYIAQLPTFTTQATDFIIEVAKIVWFIVWAVLVIMIFYSGFLFITDQWTSENMKKAKNIIIWVLLWGLVIFMLLLIMYQLFAEFA